MQAALRTLISSYCETLTDQIVEITGHLNDLQHCNADQKHALSRSLDLVHQITGLSGSMGYSEISEKSAPLEKYIRSLDTAGTCPDDAQLSQLLELFQALKDLTQAVTPEASALYDVDFRQIAACQTNTNQEPEVYAET